MFRITFTTVGFPYFNAKVKKTVPTAEPANPEKSRKAHVRAWVFGISYKCEIKIGRNIMRMSTCSQKTITFASKISLSGIRHALSVPQSAAPRPTSHGPQAAPRVLRFCIYECVNVGRLPRQYAARIKSTRAKWMKEGLTPQLMVW